MTVSPVHEAIPDIRRGSAGRSLLLLGVLALAAFVALIGLLGWLAGMTGGSLSAGKGIDAGKQAITLALLQEPPQLDSTRTTDSSSIFVLGHVMEGLLNYDEHDLLIPGVAERWEIRPEGATFKLRADAKWSDGKPVTAHDFVFAWRLAVDPKSGGQYAFLLYPIRNAEAINTGKLPITALGARALDDRTLEIVFERPIGYFDKLMGFVTYLPIREDFYRSRQGRYAADASDLLFNGPFVITRWIHGAHLRLEKNTTYWNRDRTRLNVIDMPYITNDGTAHLNLYRDGQVAMAGQLPGLGTENIKQAMLAGWPLHRSNDGTVWYLEFNHRDGRVTTNRNLRKALLLATNNNEFVYQAMKNPGYSPAQSIFPVWIKGVNAPFRKEYPAKELRQDLDEARRHFQLALKEMGLEKLPPITLLTQDTASATRHGEYLQNLFRRTLGIEVAIDSQTFKQQIAKQQAGEFDLSIYGWGPDYDDPMTFGDLFASWNPNNHGRYANPEVDRQVRIAQDSLDPATRMQAFARIQELLIEDAALIPIYERGTLYVQDPRLRGVVRRVVGADPDFTNAYVVGN